MCHLPGDTLSHRLLFVFTIFVELKPALLTIRDEEINTRHLGSKGQAGTMSVGLELKDQRVRRIREELLYSTTTHCNSHMQD